MMLVLFSGLHERNLNFFWEYRINNFFMALVIKVNFLLLSLNLL